MTQPSRLIKKYPNRRLYDTRNSAYITLADVKALVLLYEPFKVVDAKSGDDLTRAILLQIIIEEEAGSSPMFTCELLSQMIRFYGQSSQAMVSKYLENNIRAFTGMQHRLEQHAQSMYGHDSELSQELWEQFMNLQGPALNSVMGAYLDQSKKMFDEMQQQIEHQTRNMFAEFPFSAHGAQSRLDADGRAPKASPGPEESGKS